jgi:hypothetical protein
MKPATRYLLSGMTLVALVALGLQWQLRPPAGPPAIGGADLLRRVAVVATDVGDNNLQQLQLRAVALATDPAFSGYILASMQSGAPGGTVDRAAIVDLLKSRRRGYDLAMVLDAQGQPIAADGTVPGTREDIPGDPLVKRALTSLAPSSGAWVREGKLFWITVNPLMRGGIAQGLLLTAARVDDGYASTISRYTGAAVAVLVSNDTSDRHYAIASAHALPSWAITELPRFVESLPTSKLSPMSDRTLELRDDHSGETASIVPLRTASGQALVIALADTPAHTHTGWLAAWVFLLGALAVFWHWWRVERPLQLLASRVAAVARGHRPPQFTARGSPSIRGLARHLNRLFSTRRPGAECEAQRLPATGTDTAPFRERPD